MEKQLQIIIAVGSSVAAVAAGIMWLRRHSSDGGGRGEAAAGVSSATSSKPTGKQLHMEVSTVAEAAQPAKSLEAEKDQEPAAGIAADAEVAAAAEAAEAASRAAQEQAAAAAAARQVLSRATRNELIVHDMLLEGKEGSVPFLPPLDDASSAVPPRMAAGRLAAAAAASPALERGAAGAGALPPSQEQQEQMEVQQAVVGTVERAFWDALADGLRRGEAGRLAALLLDARDQLVQLLPQSAAQQQQAGVRAGTRGGSSSKGPVLLAELMEQLDGDYVSQRLQRYDAAFCAQAFDLLVHTIARLQAPARRDSTREQYAQVAALFAGAAAAEAAEAEAPAEKADVAAGAVPTAEAGPVPVQSAAGPGTPDSLSEGVQLQLLPAADGVSVRLVGTSGTRLAAVAVAAGGAAPAAAEAGQSVQLVLSCSGDSVVAQLVPVPAPLPGPVASETAAAAPASTTSKEGLGLERGGGLRWELKLVPSRSGDGSIVAVMVPADARPTSPASATAPSDPRVSTSSGPRVSEASIAAVVAAAQFMRRQLSELKADVAAAHLAFLKEAILGSGSGIEYERQRYLRALQAAAAAKTTSGSGGSSGRQSGADETAGADVTLALPLTHAWLRQVLLEAPPPPPPSPQQPTPAYSRACVAAGLLLLLQRSQAVSAKDCPETLMLDLVAIVALQNELQRLCLLAASLLIVQQILAHKRALPPSGSPAHRQLCQRVLRRMGALLSSTAPMEALVLELHQQVELALAQQAVEPAGAAPAGDAAGAAPAADTTDSAGAPSAASGALPRPEPAGAQQVSAQAQAASQPTEEAQGAQQAQAHADLGVVRRMVEQIFSTDHTAYQRVQAGIAAAATALFRSAAAEAAAVADPAASGSGSSSSNSVGSSSGCSVSGWRLTLRGIGAELLAPEVHRLAAAVDRIAAVSSEVAHPLVYGPLLAQLLQEQPLAAQLQRRRH